MKKKEVIELRSYQLPREFPVLLLSGDNWRISDIPSETLHFHNCTEIGFCCSDYGMIETLAGTHPFREGDVTFISGDVAHTTYSAPSTFSKWCYLFVDLDELLYPFFSTVLSDHLHTDALNQISINFFRVVQEEENPVLKQLVQLMVRCLIEKKHNYKTVFRSLMLAFVMTIFNEIEQPETHNEQLDYGGRIRIEPALHYIQHHHNDYRVSVEYLAGLCNVSLTHFRRLFQRSMNTSPLDHLNLVRIKASMKLLTTTNEAILTISEEVGFRSISSFNRQFLKRTGLTPSEWRKNNASISDSHLVEYNGWMEPEYPRS